MQTRDIVYQRQAQPGAGYAAAILQPTKRRQRLINQVSSMPGPLSSTLSVTASPSRCRLSVTVPRAGV